MKTHLVILIPIWAAVAHAAEQPTRANTTVVLDETGVRNLAIETVPAEESSFATTVPALGEIDHTCASHAVLSSRIPGRVIEVLIHKGEFTTKGDVIARIESRQPGNPPPVIDLIAPASGLVVRSDVHLGAPVEPEMKLLEIHDLSTVWAVAKVPQSHGSLLKEGLTATLRIPAIGEESIAADFRRLGTDADPASGTIEAVFELDNPGNRLRPGMIVELNLIASQRENILSIPRIALQGNPSDRFVFIKDYELENAFVRTPITTGESTADRVEITSGIFPGDEVVTTGSYALTFAGKGNASLKEALDAAHGHPHNEDGSEMTAEQLATASTTGSHDHGHHHTFNKATLFFAITSAILFLLLLASQIFRKPRTSHAPQNHA